ncbi:MAG: HlyD family efflux transporter periplasmic adaptor subunit [Oscillospiraceae bacterium]|nr:HlyD family efflux transporter periplasmic adaptor subunit [Oscillospiraceae bacterium]
MENKRREWVKTAAIIFLTIMLLLTFFSNTIMNYSLPEVSAKYVESGSLSEQIRGTATVEAAQQYEVKYTGSSRVVQAIEVKQGDTVEKGQVLLRFEEGESPDLQQAQSDLEAKQDEYRTKLLDAGVDYSADELSIKNLEEDIARLKQTLGGSDDYLKKIEEQKALEDKINDLTKQSNDLTKESKAFEDELTHIGEQLTALSGDDYESLDDVYSKVLSPLYDDVVKYKAEKEKYDKQVEQITKELGDKVTNEDIISKQAEISKLQSQLDALNERYLEALVSDDGDPITVAQSIKDTNTDLSKARSELNELYNKQTTSNLISQKLKTATNNQTTFTNSFNKAENKLNLQKLEISKKLNAEKKSVKAKADKKNNELDSVKAEIEDVKLDKTQADADLETINSIESKERDLESQKLALQKKQKDDLAAAGKDEIATEALQREIKRLEEKVEKIKADAAGGEITAQVAGVISSMKITAGETLESGASVASIEMTEKGYTASFSVTLDQAKKVKIGDNADIQYFWGGDAQAKLTQIKADQSDTQKKQLVFDITGDVAPGQSLQLVLGGKGQPYECIIPNNAIKEDSNGKFVLTVVAKSSPLGNRYIAKRADITVLASDGVNTAVTGVVQSDFIISTSTKPINAGDQVRLVDN